MSTSGQACILNGLPASMVIDPAGAFAYVVLNESTTCSGSATGIQAFKINSDGTITAAGSLISDPNPIALSMDAAGKFLFVAEGTNHFRPLQMQRRVRVPLHSTVSVCTRLPAVAR